MPKKKPARKRKPKPAPTPVVVVTPAPATPQQIGMVDKAAKRSFSPVYRMVETIAFIAAILELLGYMTVELLHRATIIKVSQEMHEGFPWGTLIGSVILITPKLIGRAFAGRALVAIAGGRGGDDVGVTTERETGGA